MSGVDLNASNNFTSMTMGDVGLETDRSMTQTFRNGPGDDKPDKVIQVK